MLKKGVIVVSTGGIGGSGLTGPIIAILLFSMETFPLDCCAVHRLMTRRLM